MNSLALGGGQIGYTYVNMVGLVGGNVQGRPRMMYSTPLTYKSLENPTSLFDNAEESSANALATNFNPKRQQPPPNTSFCGEWRTLTSILFTYSFFV